MLLFNKTAMPVVSAPSKALVTGANGFIAVWILRYLLEGGYTVRGTVRTPRKREHIEKVFSDFVQKGRLELVEVNDFLAVRSIHIH